MEELHAAVAATERGLANVYLPGEGVRTIDATELESLDHRPHGSQKLVGLARDLLLARTDMHDIPQTADRRWHLDFRGWLFLHFRLEGLSREVGPHGEQANLGGQSFLLSATQNGPAGTREILGESWRTVGIACKPSFLSRELGISFRELPEGLSRFQAGDPEAEFWYAGDLTPDMTSVVSSLLQPSVHRSVRPIYLRAKAVELVCLAVDRLRQPAQPPGATLKLSQHDVACLQAAKKILDATPSAITLEDLARRVGINRNKLALGFKHVFGSTVAAYHRERRLAVAYERLQRDESTIARIAHDAGYRDAGSFSKAFRLRYGVLPSEISHRA